MSALVVLTAVILAALRLAGIKAIAFQAIAHVFVGGLLGAYFVGRDRFYLYLAIGLTAIECLAFVLDRVLHVI
jgi:hypothetical protein